jgi:hypothetical protein
VAPQVETEEMRSNTRILRCAAAPSRSGLADTIRNGTISRCRSAIDPLEDDTDYPFPVQINRVGEAVVEPLEEAYTFAPGHW